MQLIKQIFEYISLVLSLVIFLFTATCFVIGKIKKKHTRVEAEDKAEELEDKLEAEEDLFKLVNEIIPLAIKKAEETPLIKGQTKKLLALSEILLNCNSNNIDFEHYKDFISEQIENLICFSKTINKRKDE